MCIDLHFGGMLRGCALSPQLGQLHLLSDVQHLQGDVIRRAALPSQLHQRSATLCRGVAGHRRFDLVLGDDAPQAIRA